MLRRGTVQDANPDGNHRTPKRATVAVLTPPSAER
jgi:hypothetical protein